MRMYPSRTSSDKTNPSPISFSFQTLPLFKSEYISIDLVRKTIVHFTTETKG